MISFSSFLQLEEPWLVTEFLCLSGLNLFTAGLEEQLLPPGAD